MTTAASTGSTADSLLAALRERVVVADGAMGTMLQAHDLGLDDFEGHEGCNEVLNVTRPDVVRQIHDAYFATGCDAVETNTFGANLPNLAEYGISDRIYEFSVAGARLAREVADGWATADRPRWVLGSVGPGTKLPNAGLPELTSDGARYPLTPEQLADAHDQFTREFGLALVGGCCGTTPDHIRAVVERVGGREVKARKPRPEPGAASLYQHVPFQQDITYLSVGERTNTNGSKAFREAMLEARWDDCVEIAREQVRDGAHVLDVCVDYVGRDGAIDMRQAAARFATASSLPPILDLTEWQVIEAGLACLGGR